MKTIEVKVYTFNELNETAKQRAISQYKSKCYDNQFYFNEIIESCIALAELFNLKFGRKYTDLRYSHIEDNILQLSGLRLYKYIVNNYWNSLYKRKFYGSIGDNKIIIHPCIKVNRYDMSKGARVNSSNFYYSRINYTNSCVLTGVCYDDDILLPVYNFLSKPQKNITFEDLINEIESAIQKTFNDTEDWINSDEFIIQGIESNEYEFTEDGEIF